MLKWISGNGSECLFSLDEPLLSSVRPNLITEVIKAPPHTELDEVGQALQAAVGCCKQRLGAAREIGFRHVTVPLLGKFDFDTSRSLCSGNVVSTRHRPSVQAFTYFDTSRSLTCDF